MGKGKKKTGSKVRKWGTTRGQTTPEASADPEVSHINGDQGGSGVTGTASTGHGKSNGGQKRSGGGQGSQGSSAGSSGVSSGGKQKGIQGSGHCLKSPAPPIVSSVASAVYAAMVEVDRGRLKGMTQNKKSPQVVNSVASAVQDALSKNVSAKTSVGTQKSPGATLAAAASAVSKGKKKAAGTQVPSATAPAVGKKGGKEVGSQTSPAPTPAASAAGGKKGGKGVGAQISPAPTPAGGPAAGGKKGGKGVGAQTTPAPTPAGPAAGVKKGGKVVGAQTTPSPTPASGPMAGKKKGAANSKKSATSSAAGKAGDGSVKEEVKPKYGFRCFVCEKVFLFNAGSTHRQSETLDVLADDPDSVILLTDSDGGIACRACSILVKSTLANRSNSKQKNNKDSREEDEETTNGKSSKNAKKRAAKKKKAEEAKETEAKAKDRQRTIYLRSTPFTKAKDIQKKFQEVTKYLIDREVHLHNLVTVDMEKGLYMGHVVEAEDKKLLLKAAPKLKHSKDLSSIFIHRTLSHNQEKELWESA